MAAAAVKEDFVTIVPVGETRSTIPDSTFVTVLTVGATLGASEVIIRRPRGARLGLGLKFEGGSAAAEKVRRLLVQSCAADSPAANAITPWGKLIPGDEILAIDRASVSDLTRIDCVRRLKDSDENLNLLVRHFESKVVNEKDTDVTDSFVLKNQNEKIRPALPPPVPPRKLGKKNSFKEKTSLHSVDEFKSCTGNDVQKQIFGEKDTKMTLISASFNNKLSRKSSFDSHIHRQNKESIASLKKGSPEQVRRLVRRLSDGKTMPPEAEVYIDLLSNEWERCLALADTESDDTGSSISTIVDRLGSITSSVENSIPSTPIMQPKTIDIQKVLNCIENIDSDILKNITSGNFYDNNFTLKNEKKSCEKYILNIVPNEPDDQEAKENSHGEEKLPKDISLINNDKNNNTTVVQNITLINLDVSRNSEHPRIPEIKMETYPNKPTPMPRNVKPDIKETKIDPIKEIAELAVTENLLTPTKKTCIESWLIRSEVEMNGNDNNSILEENNVPEALPRLIDFVPKPQFKECINDTKTVVRPLTAPPPPPVEAREDGSGASLDTIGELDETGDSAVIDKPFSASHKVKDRKSSYDSSFWEERVHKSDAEDKSLSNDESPLPTCPRQPPDGVETPSDILEKVPDSISNRAPPRLPQGWPTMRTRLSYSRAQDARSEASVKDKIAMFSHDLATSTDHIDKCGTLPSRSASSVSKTSSSSYTNYHNVKSLDRRLTKSQDNLDEVPYSYKKIIERPEALGALENNKALLNMSNGTSYRNDNEISNHEIKPIFYGSTNLLPENIGLLYSSPIHHARSISDDSTKGSQKLEYLIEQRKKSTSKLKALMIPDAQAPIVDLPEIKVENRHTHTFALNPKISNNKTQKQKTSKPLDIKDNWKMNILPNNIPKYSPAFKRKSLQLYSSSPLSKETTPEPCINDEISRCISNMNNSKSIPLKPPRQSLDIKNYREKITPIHSLQKNNLSVTNTNKAYKVYNKLADVRDLNNIEIKLCTITDVVDSDNDSAMSSTQSSYRSSASSPLHNLDSIESDSSHISPRLSHYTSFTAIKLDNPTKMISSQKSSGDYEIRTVCRSVSSDTNVSLSSSAGSAATSGSQASCSSLESSVADTDKKKLPKVYDVDTLNRKNILASAKCRNGRDDKLNSPVIETKFIHDTYEGSSSPLLTTSDRLSTLTSAVSAISNKGENRRRNKVIAASDSDTDNEFNIRKRKSEFKNNRTKRNSNATSKSKQNDIISKVSEDAPQIVAEKIIKETKMAALDNCQKKSNLNICNDKIVENSVLKVNSDPKSKDTSDNNSCDSLKIDKINGGSTLLNIRTKCNKDVIDGKVRVTENASYTVKLNKGNSTSVGLILAGGIDCEAKDVTIHRVLADSIAQRAGLKRGARVRSINGACMAGLTHAQSVAILKEPRSEVVIEIEDEIQKTETRTISGSVNESKIRPKAVCHNAQQLSRKEVRKGGDLVSVVLEKAGKAGGTGLGFSLEGGRDSQDGGRPLTIKKLFQGAVAEQSGCVKVGAELLSAAGKRMEGHTRFQAWDFLKSLPVGPVTLVLRNPSNNKS